ncbi:hypothetical protein AMS68_000546 [Peltaster fructicola]|uniref:Uncharacterized protein n=1 Tax=Peltaster fructicola TaxID=286661 RepID=A0A6H0XK67_9PEZI|nr:hypothetical protein AMS68_000546 [Peltaster fructicola]
MPLSLSILPASLMVIETWLIRIFLLLAAMSIVPLLSFFVYDFLLYIWRSIKYGALGGTPPEPPTLTGNPAGRQLKAIVNELTHESARATSTDDRDTHEEPLSTLQRRTRQQEHT